MGELLKPIRIRVGESLERDLKALAERRGESMAECTRRLLRQGVMQESANEALDPVLAAVRQAMRDVLKQVEDRLAKINAKAAIAAATAMYTNIEVVGQFGKVDVRTLHEAARKKAVAFVKTPTDKLQGDDS